jgi:hypothetical protein
MADYLSISFLYWYNSGSSLMADCLSIPFFYWSIPVCSSWPTISAFHSPLVNPNLSLLADYLSTSIPTGAIPVLTQHFALLLDNRSLSRAYATNFRPLMIFKNREQDSTNMTPFDCWWSLFPPGLMQLMLERTNSHSSLRSLRKYTPFELVQCLGILYGNSLSPDGNMFDMWKVPAEDSDKRCFFQASDIGGRWGLTKARWKAFRTAFRFWPEAASLQEQHDRWHRVRSIINEFNTHVNDVFIPGWKLCVDESMWPWLGRGDFDRRGLACLGSSRSFVSRAGWVSRSRVARA